MVGLDNGNPREEGQEVMPMVNAPGASEANTGPGMPVIKVFGIGGAGCNAISRMFKERLAMVEYYGINTDAQHLFRCDVGNRIAIGQELTKGLGAGGQPRNGKAGSRRKQGRADGCLERRRYDLLGCRYGRRNRNGSSPQS